MFNIFISRCDKCKHKLHSKVDVSLYHIYSQTFILLSTILSTFALVDKIDLVDHAELP